MGGGPVELASGARFLTMHFRSESPFDSLQDLVWAAASTSSFPDEIHAKYHRDERYSVVQTVVEVKSKMSSYFAFEAKVLVKIQYEGDVVRSSPDVRDVITGRLDQLAQGLCSEFVLRHVSEKGGIPSIEGWHGQAARQTGRGT